MEAMSTFPPNPQLDALGLETPGAIPASQLSHAHQLLERARVRGPLQMDQHPQEDFLPHLLAYAPLATTDGLIAAIVAAMTANNLVSSIVGRHGDAVRQEFGQTAYDVWDAQARIGDSESVENFRSRLIARVGRVGRLARAVHVAKLLQKHARASAVLVVSVPGWHFSPTALAAETEEDSRFYERLPMNDEGEPGCDWIRALRQSARIAARTLAQDIANLPDVRQAA
jgi:hypothetical protein